MADDGAPNPDAAMIGVTRLCHGQAGAYLRIGDILRNRRDRRWPVDLQAQKAIAATIEDHLRRVVLAVNCVGRHQLPGQVQALKQGRRRHDLVGAIAGPKAFLPNHGLSCRGKRRHHRKRRALGSGVEGAPQRLAIDRHHAFAGLSHGLRELPEAGGKRVRIQKPKHPAEGVMARNAVLERQELLEQVLPIGREIGKIGAMLGAANRRRQADRQHLQNFVALGVACSRIGNVRKAHCKPGHRPSPLHEADIRIHYEIRNYRKFLNAISLRPLHWV